MSNIINPDIRYLKNLGFKFFRDADCSIEIESKKGISLVEGSEFHLYLKQVPILDDDLKGRKYSFNGQSTATAITLAVTSGKKIQIRIGRTMDGFSSAGVCVREMSFSENNEFFINNIKKDTSDMEGLDSLFIAEEGKFSYPDSISESGSMISSEMKNSENINGVFYATTNKQSSYISAYAEEPGTSFHISINMLIKNTSSFYILETRQFSMWFDSIKSKIFIKSEETYFNRVYEVDFSVVFPIGKDFRIDIVSIENSLYIYQDGEVILSRDTPFNPLLEPLVKMDLDVVKCGVTNGTIDSDKFWLNYYGKDEKQEFIDVMKSGEDHYSAYYYSFENELPKYIYYTSFGMSTVILKAKVSNDLSNFKGRAYPIAIASTRANSFSSSEYTI